MSTNLDYGRMPALTVEQIFAYCEKKGLQIDFSPEYGEKGRTVGYLKEGILLGDWNQFPAKFVDYLEYHYNLEWADEWLICPSTGRCYRVVPDCPAWHPYYWLLDGEIVGGDLIEEDMEVQSEYIKTLIDTTDTCNLFNLDLSYHGFTQLNTESYRQGFYAGHDDEPGKILAEMQDRYPDKEFIFELESNGMFTSKFNVFGRDRE